MEGMPVESHQRVLQRCTGRRFTLWPSHAALWEGQWPTDLIDDVLVTEMPGNCDGSVFVYWLGDKRLDEPGVIAAIEAHMDDHDVVGTSVVFAFPDDAHSSLRADLARLKAAASQTGGARHV